MKIIHEINLRCTEGASDKVYNIQIAELSRKEEEYAILTTYGPYGRKLREGKSYEVIGRNEVFKSAEGIVSEKLRKGYKVTNRSDSDTSTTSNEPVAAPVTKRDWSDAFIESEDSRPSLTF